MSEAILKKSFTFFKQATRTCVMGGVFFFCWVNALPAQTKHLAFHHLNRENGLLEGYNWYVKKDSRGFVWISSIYGLNRFDGVTVVHYSQNDADPCSLLGQNIQSQFYEDKNSDLWFCTYQALHRYNRGEDCFQKYQFSYEGKTVASDYQILTLDSDGVIWLLFTGSFVVPFNTHTQEFGEPILRTNASRGNIRLDESGKVKSIVTYTTTSPILTFWQIKDGKVQQKREYQTIKKEQFNSSFSYEHLYWETESILWLAGSNGLTVFDIDRNSSKIFPNPHGIQDIITSVHPYTPTQLLLTTLGGNLCVFDKTAKKHTTCYSNQPGNPISLSKKEFANVYVDPDHAIWVSMLKGGVDWSLPQKTKFNLYTPFAALPNNGANITIHCLLEDNAGNIWCGTDAGLFILSPEKRLVKNIKEVKEIHWAFRDNENRFWFGNRESYTVFNPNSQRIIAKVNSPDSQIRFLENSSPVKGYIVLPSFKGAYDVQNIKGRFQLRKIETLGDEPYISPYRDERGRVFIARNNEGVLVGKMTSSLSFDSIGWLPIPGEIYTWFEDPASHILYAGTELGLVKLDMQNLKILKTYTITDGLPDLNVFSIQQGDSNTLWISTNNGLSKFDKHKERFRNYVIADGLPSLNFSPRAALKLRSGEILFASGSKLVSLFPGKVKDNSTLPSVQITNLLINDLPPSDALRCEITKVRNIGEIKKMVLKPYQNTLTLEFTALEYGDPKNNKLRYKLEDYDRNWLETKNPGLARFANLPHGHYTLLIEAVNADGVSNPQLKTLEIVILPRWNQTIWFYIGTILVVLLVFYGIYRVRVNQIKHLQRMRHQIASDLHDEVGSTLTGIRMFSDTVKMSLRQQHPEAIPLLDRIGDNAQKCLNSIRDIIWAINPESDKLVDLVTRMKESAITICEAKGINCVFEASPFPPSLKASPAVKHNLLLVFKESLNNALKYSQANKIEISINVAGNWLNMRVSDNGKGFDRKTITPGNGLYNMERRALDLGTHLLIDSTPGLGTSISLKVHLA